MWTELLWKKKINKQLRHVTGKSKYIYQSIVDLFRQKSGIEKLKTMELSVEKINRWNEMWRTVSYLVMVNIAQCRLTYEIRKSYDCACICGIYSILQCTYASVQSNRSTQIVTLAHVMTLNKEWEKKKQKKTKQK